MSVFFSKTSGFHDCFAWLLYFLPQSALFTFLPQIYYGLRSKHVGVSCDLRRKSSSFWSWPRQRNEIGLTLLQTTIELGTIQETTGLGYWVTNNTEMWSLRGGKYSRWAAQPSGFLHRHFPNHGMRKWSSVTAPFLLVRTGGTGAGLLRLLSPLEPLNSKLSTFRARLCKAWQRTVTEARSWMETV